MPNNDLISRADVLDLMQSYGPATYDMPYGSGDMIIRSEDVMSLPTVDAAPVVRCKDCKHRPTDNTNIRSCGGFDIEFPDEICPCQCDDGYYNWYPDSDWFCANGEAKDGGER